MVTRISHTDRNGKPWEFEIDCNPTQERMFRNLLASVHNVGAREELTLSYYDNEAANEAFRTTVETVVLSALREWTATVTENNTVRVHSHTAPDVEDGEREPYYWENF